MALTDFSLRKLLDKLPRAPRASGQSASPTDTDDLQIQLDAPRPRADSARSGGTDHSTQPESPRPDASSPHEDARPSMRKNAVLLYVGIALALLVPGLALRNIVDVGALQRLMLDITFGSGLRFWLGVLGAILTGLLLLYPLRKKFAQHLGLGSVSSWFHWHFVLGIFGPLLILYHANFGFALRDFNANVALAATLLVVVSGFIGHFIYTSASVDFYGSRKQLRTRLDALIVDLKALEASETSTAIVVQRLEEFERELPTSKLGVMQSLQRAYRTEVQHAQLYREATALIKDAQQRYAWPQQEYQRQRGAIGVNLAAAIAIARRASGRSLVEQVWARWRLLHLPLFLLMLIATTLHVRSVWVPRTPSAARAVAPVVAVPGGIPSRVYTPDEAINALRRWDATTRSLTSGQSFFTNASYVGSASCQGCHQEQNNEWANTWHAKMYRTVNDPTAKGVDNIVIGAFDGQPITFNNVRVPTEDGKETGAVSFEVVPTQVHPETRAAGYFFTVRDPSGPADSQTFQVAIVIGGNMEQMYHVKVGDNHFPAPLRWRVAPNGMSAWQVDSTPQPANWVFFRGAGNPKGKPRTLQQLPFDRFAEGQCVGCHTTGYRYERKATPRNAVWSMVGNSVGNGVGSNGTLTGPAPGAPGSAAEMGVGCESCHGPGSAHNAAQSDAGGLLPATPKPLVASKIVHPLKHMSPLQQSMMCGQCHSRGINDISPGTAATPARAANSLGFPDVTANPADRGFLPGDTDLAARIRMFAGHGQNAQAFWPNDWAKMGRMQWQDFTKSAHASTGTASCLTCHSGHAPMKSRVDNDRFQLRQSSAATLAGTSKTENQCESCHRATGSTLQPNKEMYEGSVMHAAGVTCVSCHMAPVANRTGRTTKTPAKGDGTFDTSAANYGKNWDVSSHTSRVAPTSESAQLAPGLAMRSACVSCHGPEPRAPVGTQQSDQKLDELFACRKEFVRDRLDRLQTGLKVVESLKGSVLGKARAEMQFITADRSWGAHNWDKTLRSLQAAAEDIGASCTGDVACQVTKLVALNTQECSVRTATVLAPRVTALPQPQVVAPNQTAVPAPQPGPPANAAPAQTAAAAPVPQPSAPVPQPVSPAVPPAVQPPASAAPPQVAAPPPPPTAPPVVQSPVPAVAPPAPAVVAIAPLSVFKDCDTCPDMIAVPVGSFAMGSSAAEKLRSAVEGPVRTVTIGKPFAASRTPITRDQFDAFVTDTKHVMPQGCATADIIQWIDRPDLSYRSPGFPQDGQHPVVCVTFADVTAYVDGLSKKTGKPYRAITEAEREYLTRAGTTSVYTWGDVFDARAAAYDTRVRPANAKAAVPGASSFQGTVPVQSFRTNAWGFFQVHGNVADWTADCWNRTLAGLPTDGSPATTGVCTQRVLRGGAWSYWPEDLRSAYRETVSAQKRFVHVGFRIARDIVDGQ